MLKKSGSEYKTSQLAIENIQPNLENTQNNSQGVLFDTSSENTLKNMKDSNIFFKTVEDQEHGCLWIGKPNKMLDGTRAEIEINDFDFTADIQKTLLDSTRRSVKSLIEIDSNFLDMLETTGYFDQHLNGETHRGETNK